MVFAEQMVVDVASMTSDVRAAGLGELGASAPAFVLAVWTEDMMIRAGVAWRSVRRRMAPCPNVSRDRSLGGPREISP